MAAVGFPSSLSPSRAGDFMTCPLLFRYRSIDRLPEPPTAAQVRGTLLHSALEDLFALPAPERTPHTVLRLAQEALTRLQEDDPLAAEVAIEAGPYDDAMKPLIRSYFELEDPRRLEPHGRELVMNVEVSPGFAMRGIIDRVDVAPGGAIRIVDYKTGKSPARGYESKAMFQMRFYALAWWREHDVIPRMLQLLYLGDRQVLRLEPARDELEATERKVFALRDAIGACATQEEFPATPSRLCDWCSHKALCPAFGGSPPPLPPREEWPSGSRSPQVADTEIE